MHMPYMSARSIVSSKLVRIALIILVGTVSVEPLAVASQDKSAAKPAPARPAPAARPAAPAPRPAPPANGAAHQMPANRPAPPAQGAGHPAGPNGYSRPGANPNQTPGMNQNGANRGPMNPAPNPNGVYPQGTTSTGRQFGSMPGAPPPGRQFGNGAPNTSGGRFGGATPGATPGHQFGNNPGHPGMSSRPDMRMSNGTTAHFDQRGQVRDFHTANGLHVEHGAGGWTQVRAEHNGRVLVTDRGGRIGHVDRPFAAHGHEYYHRTAFVNGHLYTHVYRPAYFRGRVVTVYAPVRYYRPAFYTYAYTPWPVPVVYRWGWDADPWFGYYRPYFTPYPAYSSPLLWLSDYLVASSLQAAYQEQVASANLVAANGPPITPEIRQSIADEVQRQLAWASQTGDQQPVPQPSGAENNGSSLPILDIVSHTLLVSTSMNVTGGADECSVSPGDVLRFDGSIPAGQDSGLASVVWSKGQDCSIGSTVAVPIEQLQEMQNQMRANLDQGLDTLQTKQGQAGLPKVANSLLGTTPAEFASQMPAPEPNVEAELRQQAAEAATAERQVNTEVASNTQVAISAQGSAPMQSTAQTRNVYVGQSPEEVVGVFGPPLTTAGDPRTKIIYLYPNLKLTFVNGHLAEAE